jgi:hypothetical protein
MRESRTYGSARGATGNRRPYRDPHWAFTLLALRQSASPALHHE